MGQKNGGGAHTNDHKQKHDGLFRMSEIKRNNDGTLVGEDVVVSATEQNCFAKTDLNKIWMSGGTFHNENMHPNRVNSILQSSHRHQYPKNAISITDKENRQDITNTNNQNNTKTTTHLQLKNSSQAGSTIIKKLKLRNFKSKCQICQSSEEPAYFYNNCQCFYCNDCAHDSCKQ